MRCEYCNKQLPKAKKHGRPRKFCKPVSGKTSCGFRKWAESHPRMAVEARKEAEHA